MINQLAQMMVMMMAMKVGIRIAAQTVIAITQVEPSWVPSAWAKLNSYALSQGIKFFSPNEAYRSMVELRMPKDDIKNGPLSEAVRAILVPYENTLTGRPLPNWKIPSRPAIDKLRTWLAGYHLIAIGEASNQVVNDVYYLVKDEFVEFANSYLRDGPADTLDATIFVGTYQWYKDLDTTLKLFVAAAEGKRSDRVIAIDALAHLLHEYEPRTLVDDLFVRGLESFASTPLWVAYGQLYDIWFGVDPRRGISFADYIEESMGG